MSGDLATRADLLAFERRLLVRVASMLMVAVGVLLAAMPHQ